MRGWRKPPTKNYPLVASAARAPSVEAEERNNGGKRNSHHPAAEKRGAGTKELVRLNENHSVTLRLLSHGERATRLMSARELGAWGEGLRPLELNFPSPASTRLAPLAKSPRPLPMGEGHALLGARPNHSRHPGQAAQRREPGSMPLPRRVGTGAMITADRRAPSRRLKARVTGECVARSRHRMTLATGSQNWAVMVALGRSSSRSSRQQPPANPGGIATPVPARREYVRERATCSVHDPGIAPRNGVQIRCESATLIRKAAFRTPSRPFGGCPPLTEG